MDKENSGEFRRVQQTGGCTYIISLPKEWINKYEIKPKDTLGIITQPDGNLLITPKVDSVDYIKTKEIDTEEIDDPNFLFRILIGSYIVGITQIIIKSSRRFKTDIRDCITHFTQIAIGPEIVEESSNYIVIKDTLNPKEMPFEKTIKRMYILAQNMHKDSITALKTKNGDLAKDVIKRDDDIDRLHWLIGRQAHIVLRDIILCQKMGITLEGANHYQQMSRFLERIADHAVKIAENALNIIKNKIDPEILQKIIESSKFSMKLLEQSLDAWLQKDIRLANKNIEMIKDLISMCEEISLNPNQNLESSIAISYIVESIRRTGLYSMDISEIIINNIISNSS